MLKRLLVTLLVFAVAGGLLFGASAPAYAVDVVSPVCDNLPQGNPGGTPTVCTDSKAAKIGPNSASNPLVGKNGLLTTYIHILALVVGFGAVIVIMLAGLRFITSSGEPQAVASARNTILYAVVGLVVAAMAQAIVTFVLGKLK